VNTMKAIWVGKPGAPCAIKKRAPDATPAAAVRANLITEVDGLQEESTTPAAPAAQASALPAGPSVPAVADTSSKAVAASSAAPPAAEPPKDERPEEPQEWSAQRLYGIPRLPGDDWSNGLHTWSEAPHDQFRIRGRYYTAKGHKLKGKKGPSAKEGYVLENVCLIPTEGRIEHTMAHFRLPPRPPGSPLDFVVVFQLPSGAEGQPRANLLLRYVRKVEFDQQVEERDAGVFADLIAKCEASGSTFAADRIKILPFLTGGAPWIMAKAVNNQPGLICAALNTLQFAGEGYLEVDIDIEGFKPSPFTGLAKQILAIVRPKVASLVIDLAFMLQGDKEAELPERLIGSARLCRINIATPFARSRPGTLTPSGNIEGDSEVTRDGVSLPEGSATSPRDWKRKSRASASPANPRKGSPRFSAR